MLAEILATATDARDLVSVIRDLLAAGLNIAERRALKNALSALRSIFFYDEDAKALLEKASRGEDIAPEVVGRASQKFQLVENEVRAALGELQALVDRDHPGLTVEAYGRLRVLSDRKYDVRWQIEIFLEELAEPPRDDEAHQLRISSAKSLLEQINELNDQIKAVDGDLRKLT